MPLSDDRQGYIAYGLVSALSVGGTILATILLLLTRRTKFQDQRFLLGLFISQIFFATLDLHPPWTGWENNTVWWVQSAIFQGARFTASGLELVILLYTIHVVRKQMLFSRCFEIELHLVCWGVGVGVTIFSGLMGQQNNTSFQDDSLTNWLWNLLTYIWLGFVLASLCAYVYLAELVRRQKAGWEVRFDPDFESRSSRESRTRLRDIQSTLLENVVRPLRLFPLIFLLTSVGELGLLVIRQLECDDDGGVCEVFYYACFTLIDARGLLYALAYFRDRELWLEARLALDRLRGSGSRRGHVRFNTEASTRLLPRVDSPSYDRNHDYADDTSPSAFVDARNRLAGSPSDNGCDTEPRAPPAPKSEGRARPSDIVPEDMSEFESRLSTSLTSRESSGSAASSHDYRRRRLQERDRRLRRSPTTNSPPLASPNVTATSTPTSESLRVASLDGKEVIDCVTEEEKEERRRVSSHDSMRGPFPAFRDTDAVELRDPIS